MQASTVGLHFWNQHGNCHDQILPEEEEVYSYPGLGGGHLNGFALL